MKRNMLAGMMVAACAYGVALAAEDDARVEYVPQAHSAVSPFDARARSGEGRLLLQAVEVRLKAYEDAVAHVPQVFLLDQRISEAQAEQARLVASREAVAEERSAECALERDAWVAARDDLIALRTRGTATAFDLEAAQARADGAQKRLSRALLSIPAVQKLDARIAATGKLVNALYVERRELVDANPAWAMTEREALDEARKAYLEYVYAP